MRIYEFRVLGMNCASCAAAAQRAVKRVHGVECCGVTLANERLRVRGDGVSCVSVIEALKKCGLTAEALEDRAALVKLQKLTQVREMRSRRFQLSVALVFALLLFYTGTGRFLGLPAPVSAEAFPLWYALIQIVMLFPVLAVSRGIFVCGFRDAVSMQPSTDTLIALGTSAAILYSLVSFFRILRGDTAAVSEMYWDTAGLILAFVLLGQRHASPHSHRRSYGGRPAVCTSRRTASCRRTLRISACKRGRILTDRGKHACGKANGRYAHRRKRERLQCIYDDRVARRRRDFPVADDPSCP